MDVEEQEWREKKRKLPKMLSINGKKLSIDSKVLEMKGTIPKDL
jgi:hypothetical protein